MRWDMYEVIIERPRAGGRVKTPKGERRRRQRTPVDEAPRREGIGRKWGQSWYVKSQTDLLGPLVRFLRSRVGRPWDDVYSEICSQIRRSSAVQDHLRDHALRLVERNVLLIDGVPCCGEPYGYGRPLAEMYGYRREWFYVCPRTGQLKILKKPPRNRAGR